MSERMNGTRERESEEEEEVESEWELESLKFSESKEEEWWELSDDNERDSDSDDEDIAEFEELLKNNNIEPVRELLATDWTLIHRYGEDIHDHAIFSDTDNTDMTKLLLSHGAPVNTRSDWNSHTNLHRVCLVGKVKLCELFLTNGARYDLKTDDTYNDAYFRFLTCEQFKLLNYKTPLHFATNVDVVKVLIR